MTAPHPQNERALARTVREAVTERTPDAPASGASERAAQEPSPVEPVGLLTHAPVAWTQAGPAL